MNLSDLRQSIDNELSHMEFTERHRRAVFSIIKGQKAARRKIPVSMVFALVLFIVAATAFAVGVLSAVVDIAIRTEKEQGYYDSWDTQSRIDFINSLADCGVAVSSEILSTLNDQNIEADGKHRVATDFMTNRYASEDVISHVTIMEKELGTLSTWPYDQKAWYTQVLEKHGGIAGDQEYYLLPDREDAQYDEIISVVREILKEHFLLSESTIMSLIEDVSFRIDSRFGDEPVWLINLSTSLEYGDTYTVLLARDGSILAIGWPGAELQFVGESRLESIDIRIIQPISTVPQYSEIIASAQDLLTEVYSVPLEEIASYVPEASFGYDSRYNDGLEPVWLVLYYTNSIASEAYTMLFAYDGSLIDAARPGNQLIYTSKKVAQLGQYEDLLNDDGQFFYDWSLEEKAAFSEKWIPIAEELLRRDPYYYGKGDLIFEMTRSVYGIPSDNDIPQDEAFQIAKQALGGYGLSDESMNQKKVSLFFIKTDAEKPLWKVWFTKPAEAESNLEEDDGRRFFITIDAKSGEVLEVEEDITGRILHDFM